MKDWKKLNLSVIHPPPWPLEHYCICNLCIESEIRQAGSMDGARPTQYCVCISVSGHGLNDI